MKINSRDLLGLAVVTESGAALGKLFSFDVDVETHAVTLYHVGPHGWPRRESYAIAPGLVVAITALQMIVADNAVRERAATPQRTIVPVPGANPAVTRNQ